MIEAAVQGACLTALIFGSLLWVHRYDARRWWIAFGKALDDE